MAHGNNTHLFETLRTLERAISHFAESTQGRAAFSCSDLTKALDLLFQEFEDTNRNILSSSSHLGISGGVLRTLIEQPLRELRELRECIVLHNKDFHVSSAAPFSIAESHDRSLTPRASIPSGPLCFWLSELQTGVLVCHLIDSQPGAASLSISSLRVLAQDLHNQQRSTDHHLVKNTFVHFGAVAGPHRCSLKRCASDSFVDADPRAQATGPAPKDGVIQAAEAEAEARPKPVEAVGVAKPHAWQPQQQGSQQQTQQPQQQQHEQQDERHEQKLRQLQEIGHHHAFVRQEWVAPNDVEMTSHCSGASTVWTTRALLGRGRKAGNSPSRSISPSTSRSVDIGTSLVMSANNLPQKPQQQQQGVASRPHLQQNHFAGMEVELELCQENSAQTSSPASAFAGAWRALEPSEADSSEVSTETGRSSCRAPIVQPLGSGLRPPNRRGVQRVGGLSLRCDAGFPSTRKPLTPGLVEVPTMPKEIGTSKPGIPSRVFSIKDQAAAELPTDQDQMSHQQTVWSQHSPPRKSRWWTQLSDICPISHFPVCMLPYPPHKLPMGQKRYVLIDGFFLALQVLESWNFQVLDGRVLGNDDLRELDAYMKRCKLGSFRLVHAVSLESKRSSMDAQAELKTLRKTASERLETLRIIQRKRARPLNQSVRQPTSRGAVVQL